MSGGMEFTGLPGLGLLAGGIESLFQLFAGDEAKGAYDYNAQIAEQDADLIREGAKLEEFKSRKKLKQFTGNQVAAYARSGVEMTGSPLDVIQDSMANAELEIAINQFNLETKARGKESEATRMREYGEKEKTASQIQAAGTLLSSAGDFASKYYVPKKKKIGA